MKLYYPFILTNILCGVKFSLNYVLRFFKFIAFFITSYHKLFVLVTIVLRSISQNLSLIHSPCKKQAKLFSGILFSTLPFNLCIIFLNIDTIHRRHRKISCMTKCTSGDYFRNIFAECSPRYYTGSSRCMTQ